MMPNVKLTHLSTSNLRGIPNGDYPFATNTAGEALDVALICGPSPSGKTTMLRAIFAAARAVESRGAGDTGAALLRQGADHGSVTTSWQVARAPGASSSHFSARWEIYASRRSIVECDDELVSLFRHEERGTDSMVYFGDQRVLFGDSPRPYPLHAPAEHLRRSPPSAGFYECIPWLLVQLSRAHERALAETLTERGVATTFDSPDPLGSLRERLVRVLPDLRLTTVHVHRERPVLNFATHNGSTVPLTALSSSERQAFLIVATLTLLDVHGSVVFIDSPELGVADESLQDFFERLLSATGENQVIAATGSKALTAASGRVVARLPASRATI